jgi:hypothetical protein
LLLARLQKEGFIVLNEIQKGADNKLVSFCIQKYKRRFDRVVSGNKII